MVRRVGPNQQGYDACNKGDQLSDNPFRKGSLAFRMWKDGWQDAEEEEIVPDAIAIGKK